ncbi:MAG: TadE family protein [Sphingorhabdus sp.]
MTKIQKLITLARDNSGVSVVEFGMIAPALILMIIGAMDVGHTLYMRTVINGALQDAGRSSSLEGSAVTSEQSRIDNNIKRIIRKLAPNAGVTVNRRYYKTFSDAALAEAESWTDDNDNNTCDNNEPYVDENNNEAWDADGGNNGQGGARDIVIITATVNYERLFPMAGLLGLSDDVSFTSDSILANQPYGEQQLYGTAVVRNCS